MSKLTLSLCCLLAGLLSSLVFYEQTAGLNLALFELPLLTLLVYFNRDVFAHRMAQWVIVGLLLSLLAFLVVHSSLALCVHIFFFVLTSGLVSGHAIRSPFYMASAAFEKLTTFVSPSTYPASASKRFRPAYIFRLSIIPLLVIMVFLMLYAAAVPRFGSALSDILKEINVARVGLFVMGVALSIFILFVAKTNFSSQSDAKAGDVLKRIKSKFNKPGLSANLKNEVFSSVIMLGGLNLLILIINLFDVSTYWFSYQPETYEDMKQLVHSGTYLLIFCILLSLLVVLLIFRGNINFYTKNRLLKYFALAWLAQNAFMICSVAWRNYWYIQSYNLAFKRIWVFLFLVAALVGIVTTLLKIRDKKSIYFLVRTNSTIVLSILLLVSFFNWDKFIVNYNLANKDTAYVHKNFLVSLDNSVLPQLIENSRYFDTPIEIEKPYQQFLSHFPDAKTYRDIIEKRKEMFLLSKENGSWLSWNLNDDLTYSELKKKGGRLK